MLDTWLADDPSVTLPRTDTGTLTTSGRSKVSPRLAR